jgi:hypothetical protein
MRCEKPCSRFTNSAWRNGYGLGKALASPGDFDRFLSSFALHDPLPPENSPLALTILDVSLAHGEFSGSRRDQDDQRGY